MCLFYPWIASFLLSTTRNQVILFRQFFLSSSLSSSFNDKEFIKISRGNRNDFNFSRLLTNRLVNLLALVSLITTLSHRSKTQRDNRKKVSLFEDTCVIYDHVKHKGKHSSAKQHGTRSQINLKCFFGFSTLKTIEVNVWTTHVDMKKINKHSFLDPSRFNRMMNELKKDFQCFSLLCTLISWWMECFLFFNLLFAMSYLSLKLSK